MTMNLTFGKRLSDFNLIQGTYEEPIDENVDAQITQIEGPSIINYQSENNEFKFQCLNSGFIPIRFLLLNEHNQSLYNKVVPADSNGIGRIILSGKEFLVNSDISFFIKASSDNKMTFSKKQKFTYNVMQDEIKKPTGSITINTSNIQIDLNQPEKFYKYDFTGYDLDSKPVGIHKATKYIVQSGTNYLYEHYTESELYQHTFNISELNLSKDTIINVYVFYIDSYGLWSLKALIGSGNIDI